MTDGTRRTTASARTVARFAFACLLAAGAIQFASDAARAADGEVLGRYFAASGLPNNWVKGIFRDGAAVVVTAGDSRGGDTVVFDRPKNAFVRFSPGPGFRGRRVSGWAEYGGKSFAGTESALNVREGTRWTSLDRFKQVQHSDELLYSDGKRLYAAARVMFGGVLRYDGKEWEVVDRGQGTGIMNNATSLLTRGDELFIGTTTGGLLYYTGKEWKVFGPADGLPGIWVTSLAVTDEGVWVGGNQGLALFDGEKFKVFTVRNGLPSNKVSILKVVKGKLLVGTMDAGLSIRERGRFFNVSAAQGLSDPRVQAIEEAEEGAWVGTVNGLNLVEVRR